MFLYGFYQGATSAFWSPDKPNSLTMPDVTKPAAVKRIAQAEAIDLDEMKRIKDKFPGVTLNDVMMAVMTATVRAYLMEVNDPAATNGQKVRGAFPINLRSGDETLLRRGEPMNKWAYGMFRFDFDYDSRVDLVWKVKRQVDKIKASPSPVVLSSAITVLTRVVPRWFMLNTASGMVNLSSAQLSNVPGPSTPIHIAGAQVDDMQFNMFSPAGLYFGILSYNGKVTAGVNVDGTTSIDAKMLAKHWLREFEALKQEVEAFGDGQIPLPKRTWF